MKKAAKIVLLVVLLAMVGGIVYTVLTWPIYPQPEKNVDSYAQLREDLAQTELLAPPEDILPWQRPCVPGRCVLLCGAGGPGGPLLCFRGNTAAGKLPDGTHLPVHGRAGDAVHIQYPGQ